MKRLLAVCIAAFAALLCAACASTYGSALGHAEVRNVVDVEVASVRGIGVQRDFVDWSVTTIDRTPAPRDVENLRGELAQGFHRFVRAIVGYAVGRGDTALSAATGRAFLRQSVKCGVIPCDTRKCCDFCRRLCVQKEPPPDSVAGILTAAVCPPAEP